MPYYARMARRNLKTSSMFDLVSLNREARLLLGSLIFGAVGAPLLVWIVGRISLGPYANGGMFAILGDFFTLLFSGSLAAWIVLVAPYVLISALRLAAWATRRL